MAGQGRAREELARAMREGRLRQGGLRFAPTTAEELADVEVEARLWQADPGRGVPVVLRLSEGTVEWLKAQADGAGIQGWRRLLRERVEEMAAEGGY